MINVAQLLHQTVCGGLAAAGFGVLFNVSFRSLGWCAASGAVALFVRTFVLSHGWTLEAASFVAALALGLIVQLLPAPTGVSRNGLHVVGCIPMIPGGFAAKAILGLFAVTQQTATSDTLMVAIENLVHVTLTVGSLGTGLAIPILLLRTQRRAACGTPRSS